MEQLQLRIPDELFAEAESSSFNGTYDPKTISAGADTYTFAEPLAYNLLVTNTGGALLFTGSVKGTGVCNCARCLEPATYDFDSEVEEYILLPGERDVEEVEEEDEFIIMGEDHIVDLESILQAAIVLDFPLIPLCKEDCQGLCPQCGANLNEGECSCEPEDDFDTNPFAALKNYRFDEED